jgi:hypothetical protein
MATFLRSSDNVQLDSQIFCPNTPTIEVPTSDVWPAERPPDLASLAMYARD